MKVLIANLLANNFSGAIIKWLFGNRIPHFGSRIEIPNELSPGTAAALFWRLHESAEVRFVQKYIQSNLVIVELGANIGGVSSQIARILSN